MTSDSLPTAPLARTIRIAMQVAGQQIGAGLLSFSVANNNYFSADTWNARIALSGLPTGYGAPFWALQPSVQVMFLASLNGGALQPVTGGMVDDVEIDLDQQTMRISGRDFTAPLIDNLSNDKFTNQTSSQVATTLAARRGLTPQVTATSTQVGRYLAGQTDYMAEDISEWRLLSFLAEQEGFDVYATGKTLVFAPAASDPAPLTVQYRYANPQSPNVQSNEPRIMLRQRKTLAGPVTVQVRSWQYQNKQAVIATWKATKTQGAAGSAGGTTTFSRAETESGDGANGPFYIERRSGLTQAQADDLAQKKLADFGSHEREVEISGPGIIGIDSRRTLRLTGTGTAFDQDYPIKSVQRTFGWEEGCRMTITAKSGSPQQAQRL